MSVEMTLVRQLISTHPFADVHMAKYALERNNNNPELATKFLQKWSAAPVSSISSIAKAVIAHISDDGQSAGIISFSCNNPLLIKEADFFEAGLQAVREVANTGALSNSLLLLNDLQSRHDCSIGVRFDRLTKKSERSLITIYNHRDERSSIVETSIEDISSLSNHKFKSFSFDCAMHAVAYTPYALKEEGIDLVTKSRVKLQIEHQLADQIQEMKHWAIAISGKYNKWVEQNTFLTQLFIKSENESVQTVCARLSQEIGKEISIIDFKCFTGADG